MSNSAAADAHRKLFHLLGGFTVLWSIFDGLLDAAITKELRLTTEEGAILTCGLAFERKVSILKSLLALQDDKHAGTAATISKISEIAKRNVIMHGMVIVDPDSLSFLKLDTDAKLKARLVKHSPKSLNEALSEMRRLIDEVQAALGVTEDERTAIPKMGDRLSNKNA